MKTYFFGWGNIKWFLRELNKMYSESSPSFFAKKRIEGGIAFIIMQWGMIHWFIVNLTGPSTTSTTANTIVVHGISSSDLFIWASIEAVFCGYVLSKIEASKKAADIAQ